MKAVLVLAVVAVGLGGTLAKNNCHTQERRLSRRVSALTNQVSTLAKRLDQKCPWHTGSDTLATQVKQISKQQVQLKMQIGKLGNLPYRVSALDKKQKSLKKHVIKLGNLQTQVSSLDSYQRAMKGQLAKLGNLQSQVSAIAKKQGLGKMQVGFHVQYRGTHTLHQGAQVTFNSCLFNKGNGFQHNKFTAPVSGMYMFYLQIEPDPKHKSGMQVNVSGHNRVLYVFANDPHTYEMASGQRVIHLSKGQQAWVITTDAGNNRLRWNTNFGGFLVKADA